MQAAGGRVLRPPRSLKSSEVGKGEQHDPADKIEQRTIFIEPYADRDN